MKKLFVKKDVPCMACLECVRACSTAFYKEFHQDKACLKIVERNGKVRPMTCVQCGKCAAACEHGAITQNPKTGVYMVNKKLCVGCGKCVEACPFGVMLQVAGAPPPRSASPAASVSRPARWRSSRSARADCAIIFCRIAMPCFRGMAFFVLSPGNMVENPGLI